MKTASPKYSTLSACSFMMMLLVVMIMITGCSSSQTMQFKSRENPNLAQRTDNLQALIDQTPDNTTLRIVKGKYIINQGLVIKGRVGLSVIAEPGTAILLTNLEQDVLTIEGSKHISLFNVLMRHHTPLTEYRCEGGVIRIDDSKDITIANSELNGCGAVGVSAQNTQSLTIEHCYIHNNSFNALYLSSVDGLRLWSNVIADNANTLQLYNVTDMQMSDNIITRNTGYWRTPTHEAGLMEWSPKKAEASVVNDK